MPDSDQGPFEDALEAWVDGSPIDLNKLEQEGRCTKRQLEVLRRLLVDEETDEEGDDEKSADFEELTPDPDLPYTRIGDYELKRMLGRGKGGMGQVFLALDLSSKLNKRVALKIPRLPHSGRVRERFQEEIRALSKLAFHPSVVPVLACDEHNGMPFFVMEYIPGRDLEDEIKERASCNERVATKTALKWARQVASGLEYLHKNSLIHLDVKPANVRITPENDAVLVDFGVARDIGKRRTREDRWGPFTPLYAAPEQVDPARGHADARTDVWSLGVTLYEMLTGCTPFGGHTEEEIISHILRKQPTRPRKLNRKLSRGTQTVVMGALEKDLSRRYQSMPEMGADIERVSAGEDPDYRRPPLVVRVVRRFLRNTPALALAVAMLVGVACLVYWRVTTTREAQRIRADSLGRFEEMARGEQASLTDERIQNVLIGVDALCEDSPDSPEAAQAQQLVETLVEEFWGSLGSRELGRDADNEWVERVIATIRSNEGALQRSLRGSVRDDLDNLDAFWQVRGAYEKYKVDYMAGREKCAILREAREDWLSGDSGGGPSKEESSGPAYEKARADLWELNQHLAVAEDRLYRACVNVENVLGKLGNSGHRNILGRQYRALRLDFADVQRTSTWRRDESSVWGHLEKIIEGYGCRWGETFSTWVECTPAPEEAYLFRYVPYKNELGRKVPVPVRWRVGETGVTGEEEGIRYGEEPNEDQVFRPGDLCLEVVSVEDPRANEATIRKGDLIVKIAGATAVPGLFVAEVENQTAADRNGVKPFDRIEYFGDRTIENFYDLKKSDSPDKNHWRVEIAGGDRTTGIVFEVQGYREEWGETPSEVLKELTGITPVDAATLVSVYDIPDNGISLTVIHNGHAENVRLEGKANLKARETAYPLIFDQEHSQVCPDEVSHGSWEMNDLEEGSYLLVLRREGFRDLRVPFEVPWILGSTESAGRLEGKSSRIEATLIPETDAIPGFVWVPGGPFKSARDPGAFMGWTAIERREVADGFWIAEHEVTLDEWMKFVNDPEVLEKADKAVGEGLKPGVPTVRGRADVKDLSGLHLLSYYFYPIGYFERSPTGFRLVREEEWDRSQPAWGVRGISAQEFVEWKNRSKDDPEIEYFLPDPDQAEKAAGGVDGRLYPWGDTFDWSLTKGRNTRPLRNVSGATDSLTPERVMAIPYDESVYGVRDMAGSIKEWTVGSVSKRWVGKGGSWADGDERTFRCAYELPVPDDYTDHKMGLRLCARRRHPSAQEP